MRAKSTATAGSADTSANIALAIGYLEGVPTYRFSPISSLADVATLRTERLASLAALPELFVEAQVRRSAVYTIEQEGVVGYLAALEGTLTEMWLRPAHDERAGTVLAEAAKALGLARAWACTFDPLAMAACRSVPRTHRVLGYSFRTFDPAALPDPDPLPAARVAREGDLARIEAANHPEVFADAQEIAQWVGAGQVTLFEVRDDLAGFGLWTPAGPETPACDIGVRVCPPFQRQGMGSWIVQRMAASVRRKGLLPTAGCGADNPVSKRMLERAGFVADHRLLEFAV